MEISMIYTFEESSLAFSFYISLFLRSNLLKNYLQQIKRIFFTAFKVDFYVIQYVFKNLNRYIILLDYKKLVL